MSAVLSEHSEQIARITLNRPHRLNAINKDLLVELDAALERAEADEKVRVVLWTGAGSAFCAGDDLVELAETPPSAEDAEAGVAILQQVTRRIMLGSKTVICLVNGWAVGGGASWPLNADLTLWSEEARLRFPEGRHGLFPSGGVTWLLSQYCGPQRAMEILLGGEKLGADQLVADRIATKTEKPDLLRANGEQLALRLLSLPGETLERYKRARAATLKAPLERALKAEQAEMIDAVRVLVETGDYPEIKRA